MVLKANDTEKVNITMTLHIDEEQEEISIHIRFENKQTGIISGFEYSAADYSKALMKCRELESIYN